MDVVKSRVQAVPFGSERVTPYRRVVREIWRARGWRGFWVGYSVMAVRSVPVNAMTFFGYELVLALW